MTPDDFLDAILGPLNIFDRIEGLITSLRYGDYSTARKRGAGWVAIEVLSSVAGANTHRFSLVRKKDHNLNEVESLLRRYGIPVFGRTHDDKNMYFSVKKRQARWAEYILLNAGVELANPTFDRRNPGYVGRHGPGWMPTPWSEKERGEPAPVETPTAKPTSSLARLSRWMDELLED